MNIAHTYIFRPRFGAEIAPKPCTFSKIRLLTNFLRILPCFCKKKIRYKNAAVLSWQLPQFSTIKYRYICDKCIKFATAIWFSVYSNSIQIVWTFYFKIVRKVEKKWFWKWEQNSNWRIWIDLYHNNGSLPIYIYIYIYEI